MMKRASERMISWVLCAVMLLTMISVFSLRTRAETVDSAQIGLNGSGTEDAPFCIYTLADLELFRDSVNAGQSYEGKYVILMADIIMNEPDMFAYDEDGYIIGTAKDKTPYEWIPIGNSTFPFYGCFDGNEHKIIGLHIESTNGNQGLFGYCKNVQIQNLFVIGSYVKGGSVGGIAGCISPSSGISTIENCCFNGLIRVDGIGGIGGIVGTIDSYSSKASTLVIDCVSSGMVYGENVVGGIVGTNSAFYGLAKVENCINYGIIKGYDCIGGVVGQNKVYSNSAIVSVIGCSNEGTIDGRDDVGGAVGCNVATYGSILVENSNNTASISGRSIGGIAGSIYTEKKSATVSVLNCSNSGGLVGTGENGLCLAGGIVGDISGSGSGLVDNCNNSAPVIVSGYSAVAGGVVGENRGLVINSNNTGAISGSSNVGGVVGDNSAKDGDSIASIVDCNNSGDISGIEYVGGIAGKNSASWDNATATVINCNNFGAVSGVSYVGGAIGSNETYEDSSLAVVQNCKNEGPVNSTDDYTGGVVGYNDTFRSSTAIKNCINSGTVCGHNYSGGIVGYNIISGGTTALENCVNTAIIKGRSNIGGIVGCSESRFSSEMTVEHCNNTDEICGECENIGGIVGINYADSTSKATVDNCNNTGNVNSNEENYSGDSENVGGVVGDNRGGTAIVTNCNNTGEIIGSISVGGIVGYNEAYTKSAISKVFNCNNSGIVRSFSHYTGGVVGYNYSEKGGSATVDTSYNTGSIFGTSDIGGVVGMNHSYDATSSVLIKKCYIHGSVSGSSDSIGGVVGVNYAFRGIGTVDDSFNSGIVYGIEFVGGVVGYNYASSETATASVMNCYNSGIVFGENDFVCGLVGYNCAKGSGSQVNLQNCYYLTYTSALGFDISFLNNGTINIDNVVAVTDEQMRSASSFIGFDFDEVWTMEGEPDYPYPELIGYHILGDANGDGEITILDATVIQRKLAGFSIVFFKPLTADISGNGLDIIDATLVQRFLVGYAVPYDIGQPVH